MNVQYIIASIARARGQIVYTWDHSALSVRVHVRLYMNVHYT